MHPQHIGTCLLVVRRGPRQTARMNRIASGNSAWLDRFVAVVLRHRWPVAVLVILMMLAAAGGVRFIVITSDYRMMFGEDNLRLVEFDAFENTYSASYRSLIAVAPRQGSIFTRESLRAIEELTEAAWHAPYSNRVDSLTNYSHSEAFGDVLVVAPLVDDARSLSDDDLARVERIALDTIDLSGRLVSRDGKVGAVTVSFVLSSKADSAVLEINNYLDDLMEQARASHPGIAYYMVGNPSMDRVFADATKDDMSTLTPFMFLVMVVVAILLLRSVLGTVAVVVTALFAIGTTMGVAGWLSIVFSPTNAGVPIIVMAIAVAHSIHIVTSVLQGLRRGLDRDAAILESIRINAYPVFLTSLTTMIGFLSLNASDTPPFHILGNFVAFGVFCAFVYSMTLLPALLSILPLRTPASQTGEGDFFGRFSEFVVARRRLLLWLVTLSALVLITGVLRIELTDKWVHYFDQRYEFRRSADFVSQNLAGMDILEYSLNSGREEGVTDPAYLHAVETFAGWYREQPEVFHVTAFSDIMKRLNKNMHGDDPQYYRLPDSPQLAAQYLLLYELSLPAGLDLNDRIDISRSATRMTVVAHDISTQGLRELDERAQAWIHANRPGFASEATGLSMLFAHLSIQNIKSMLGSTGIAMTLISLILVLALRSLRIGLVSLVPNFVPLVVAFGLWGYVFGEIGMAASVVTVIAFGVIVDDTIHFLYRYVKSRRDGLSAPSAVHRTFRTVGQALGTTTVVLSAGFLVLALSGFSGSTALGLLVTIIIVLALATDFLLLPSLLIAIDRKTS